MLLRDLGCEVDVFERSQAELFGFGAGIVVHETTMRYFKERSTVDLADVCVPASRFRYVNAAGSVVHDEPSPYRFTSWGTLYRNLIELFGLERYHRGHEMVGVEQDTGGVEVAFANGRRARCDLLICADGILSTGRELFAPEVEPVYSGYIGWRGTVEETKLSGPAADLLVDAITYGIVDHSHMLAYPIQSPASSSKRLLNFVWYRNVAAGEEFDSLMVDREGRPRAISIHPGDMQERYIAELRMAAEELLPPPLATLVRAAESPFLQAMVDVTVETMVYGRVCLIGDAAFTARPHAAAGTAKAAENCWALADAIASHDDLDEALAAWEPAQVALGCELVARSRRLGELYQVHSAAVPGDPELRFGLYGPDR